MSEQEIERETVSLPDEVEFPRSMDFFDLQGEEYTEIHEFYANLRDGQLTTTECADCGATHFPPRIVCPECTGDELAYVDLPHEGELYSFTEVRGAGALGVNEDTPFVTGIVDLGDVRLSARIDDAEYDDLAIGDRVRLKIIDIEGPFDDERAFYRFVPA